MSVLPIGIGSSGGYIIENSVRLRASASAYFSRTPASAGDRKKWTFSTWGKRGTLGAGAQHVLSAGPGSNTDFGIISFDYSGNADKICVIDYPGGGSVDLRSTRVCRDTSGHYHLVVTIDTTQATAADRVKIWWNNEQITAFDSATYPSLNADTRFNSTSMHYIGAGRYLATSGYYDGLLSDVYFIDGQALTPSSFGETNADGVWVPKAYTGTYGNNGFHLDFADAALTSGSNAGLGKDVSGNGNYWNTNNISVTAGVTYDSMVDTPTNNYATPSSIVVEGGVPTFSNANLRISNVALTSVGVAPFGLSAGKWRAEYTIESSVAGVPQVGIIKAGVGTISTNGLGNSANAWVYISSGLRGNNNSFSAYGAGYTVGDVIAWEFDADAGTLVFFKNGVSQGTAFTGLTNGPYFPAFGGSSAGNLVQASLNFGQQPWNNTPSTGFKALCTANLPSVAIKNPKKHFNAKTRTGTAATFSVTGELFQPGMVWTKGRSGATDHAIYDAVRGVEKRLETNNTDAEVTGDTTGLTAFNSDGFTGGALAQINTNSATYIDWMWKANGAGSSNTDGSRTSTVSANITAGFSIASFNTGAAANVTVGHGLSVVPSMIILKNRSTQEWNVWHKNLTNTQDRFLILNANNGEGTSVRMWANTAPTSSVFSIESGYTIAASTDAIAYNFAEVPGYSKFGTYSATGSGADQAFIYCGFRPRWIMVKVKTTLDQWAIIDTARSAYNPISIELYANTSGTEYTMGSGSVDIVSNGFKIRTPADSVGSAQTMIYAAFAEHPFGGSNCAPAPAR